ncbi:hypothetical protein BG011_005076 [Mortierella polycephala]|uniref:Uncharacterized protein n=1 Tax=Mortierella polycephala TaxID=41804 RepID=A0A9P6PZR5_9FUNG|nr:hypothetical protein BG011_005076 [Mortierella polycephala]
MTVKSFQAALWERAIFRVLRTTVNKKQDDNAVESLKEAERTEEHWIIASESLVCSEPKSDGLCPPGIVMYRATAVFHAVSDIRMFSIAVTGTETASESKTGRRGGTVEQDLGDIPVVVCGVPGESAYDGTGLPTYMGSFSTSLPSLEETQHYGATQTRASMNLDLARVSIEGFTGRDSARHSMLSKSSMTSHPGTLMSLPEDYENDDTFMAVMGLRGTCIPPGYEVSIAWQTFDSSAGEMQRPDAYTNSSSSHSQDH